MEKRVPVKTLYLLLVIAVGLIVLGVGSTYAVFTASSEIDSPIVFNTSLSYTGDLIETVSVKVPSNKVVSNTLKITNSTGSSLNYVVWYINEGLDVEFGISSGSSTGKLNGGNTSNVVVDIRNNTNNDVTIILGISSSDNGVVLGENMTIIPNSELPEMIVQGTALYITNLYLGANPTKITQSNSGDSYYYASSVNLMNDGLGESGNIRYYGKNPDNYIYFNCSDYGNQNSSTCEKWRIIGVFDGKLKIVRDQPIGNFSWDYAPNGGYYDNNWHDSTLMELLNNGYYNNSDNISYYNNSDTAITVNFSSSNVGIKNEKTRNLILESTWYLGGANASSYYPDEMYKDIERGNSYGANPSATWSGKIALMYPSDYGFASDLSVCNLPLAGYKDSIDCKDTNWLYNSSYDQVLISPNGPYINGVKRINSNGYINNNAVNAIMAVRPTLYLSSDISILDGDGTSESPFIIG